MDTKKIQNVLLCEFWYGTALQPTQLQPLWNSWIHTLWHIQHPIMEPVVNQPCFLWKFSQNLYFLKLRKKRWYLRQKQHYFYSIFSILRFNVVYSRIITHNISLKKETTQMVLCKWNCHFISILINQNQFLGHGINLWLNQFEPYYSFWCWIIQQKSFFFW